MERNSKGQFKKGSSGFTGKHSDVTKKKISDRKKGTPAWNKGEKMWWYKSGGLGFKKGNIPWNKGLKGFMAGSKNSNWRGGITSLHEKIRKSDEYKKWREKVLKRDKWRCVKCGAVQSRKVKVIADHIKPFTLFPALRFVVKNGRTLCKPCDDKYGFKWNRHLSWEKNFKRYQLMNSNK